MLLNALNCLIESGAKRPEARVPFTQFLLLLLEERQGAGITNFAKGFCRGTSHVRVSLQQEKQAIKGASIANQAQRLHCHATHVRFD